MEISGEYADVVSKLNLGEDTENHLQPFIEDVRVLLETISRINGGTRSAIAEELSANTVTPFDPQTVVETLKVLERYDLVSLEGNTWKPGPELQRDDK